MIDLLILKIWENMIHSKINNINQTSECGYVNIFMGQEIFYKAYIYNSKNDLFVLRAGNA